MTTRHEVYEHILHNYCDKDIFILDNETYSFDQMLDKYVHMSIAKKVTDEKLDLKEFIQELVL